MVSPPTDADTPPPADSDAEPQAPKSADRAANAKPDLWSPLLLHVDELREYFYYYLGARADLVRAHARRLVLAALLVLVGAVVAATLAATATVLLLIGLGEGLGRLLGERVWLGNVLTGALVLATAGVGGLWAARWLINNSRLRTIRSYAQRRERQRRQFGRDVSSRARSH
jgi:hypothetical protein